MPRKTSKWVSMQKDVGNSAMRFAVNLISMNLYDSSRSIDTIAYMYVLCERLIWMRLTVHYFSYRELVKNTPCIIL